jgi:hypothetical protein
MAMKATILLCCQLTAVAASAATVTYDFESSTNNATISGSGFTTGPLTENGNSASSPNNPLSTGAVYGRLASGSGGVPADTTIVRAFVPLNVSNHSNPPVTTHTTYLEFTITPEAGQTLDFSSATFSFTLGAITGNSPNLTMPAYARAGVQINNGSFINLGAVLSATADAYNAATPNWTSSLGFNTTSGSYDIAQAILSPVSLGSILGGLNAGDTVTFRIAAGDSSTVNTALNAGSSMKSLYVDDISVSGFNVIPEPAAGLLSALGFAGILLRRRA